MAKFNTSFKIADNSGVKTILCIRNLTRKANKICLGDLIVGVVKDISSSSKLIQSNIVYAVVIRLKKFVYSKTSYTLTFNDNAAVLVDKNLNPLGSRIFGSVPKYLKEHNYLKLNSLTVDLI